MRLSQTLGIDPGRARGRTSRAVWIVGCTAVVAAGLAMGPGSTTATPSALTAAELPALPSTPAPRTTAVRPSTTFTPPASLKDLKARGSTFDPARSTPIPGASTPTAIAYDNHDGTRTLAISSFPARAKGADGQWRSVDHTLVADAAGASPRVAASNVSAPNFADGALTVATSAGQVRVTHPRAAHAPVQLDGADARYSDALGTGAALVEAVGDDGVEESVVLDSPSAGSSYDVVFSVPKGVTASAVGDDVEFRNAAGAIGRFGGAIAWDSASPHNRAHVSLSITNQSTTEITVHVAVDDTWLHDPARVFPVTIDPTASWTSNPVDMNRASIRAGAATQWNTTLDVGRPTGASSAARALFQVTLPGWNPTDNNFFTAAAVQDPYKLAVTEAHVSTTMTSAASCPLTFDVYGLAARWDRFTTTSDEPATDGNTPSATTLSSCSSTVSLDTTALAQRWL